MTVWKAFTIKKRNGGPNSRLIQTFLREGECRSVAFLDRTDQGPRCILLHSNFHCKLGEILSVDLAVILIRPQIRLMEYSIYSKAMRRRTVPKLMPSYYRPRQVISAINIPLSVMLGPVLACRLVSGPLNRWLM
jgi:hypothetical protein